MKRFLFIVAILIPCAGGARAEGPPERVLTLTPGLTEIAFALGTGDRVAGVARFSDYPPAARDKPICGDYLRPNFERIMALKPDLVLVQGKHNPAIDFCRRREIACRVVAIESIGDIKRAILDLGEVFNRQKEAQKIVHEIV